MSIGASSLAPTLLAEVESAVLVSVLRPIIVLAVVAGWARIVSFLDKDSRRLTLNRRTWNAIQLAAGVLGCFLWLMIPFFALGMLVALIIFIGTIGGYVMYRNTKVDPSRQWHFSLDTFKQKLGEMEHARIQQRAAVRLLTRDGGPIQVPSGDNPLTQAHVLLEHLLDFALPRGANRIEVVVSADKAAIGVRVDGVVYPQPAIEPRLAMALIEYLKQHAGLDMEDRRRRQRGTLKVEAGDAVRHELTIVSSGSTRGLSLVVVIDQEKATLMSLTKMGLLDSQRQQLKPVLNVKTLAIIVTCPLRQGMTTTINSMVNLHDPYTLSIVTLEMETEIELEGVNHEKLAPDADPQTIERRLAALLRSDPAVVMVETLVGASYARLIATSARELRFYFGMRCEDTFAALKVWLNTVGDDKLAAGGLGAIVSQRLVRKLCPTCRVAYKPDPNVLRKLNLPAQRVPQLYKHSGKIRVGKDRTQTCSTCLGMGYRGRVGVFEIMVLDDEARKILAAGQMDQFRAHLRRHKMLYLQESALLKVVEGQTSISEITRALGANKKHNEASGSRMLRAE